MGRPPPAHCDATTLGSCKKIGRPRSMSSRWMIDVPQKIVVVDEPDDLAEGTKTSGVEMRV